MFDNLEKADSRSAMELCGELLHTDRALDRASKRKDFCESTRLGEKLRAVSFDFVRARPETGREVYIVLMDVASSIAAADDPVGDYLIPELRRIARAARRGAATIGDVLWLRAAAVLSKSIYDGGAPCVDLAPRILAAAECIGRPRPV